MNSKNEQALTRSVKTSEVVSGEWRCYHCGEVFKDDDSAKEHFGATLYSQPGCQIDIAEYRRLEKQLEKERWNEQQAEDEFVAMQADMEVKIRRAEEEGYAKGLADAKKWPEELGLMRA